MRVMIVGDGNRDPASIKPLVEKILGCRLDFEPENDFQPWTAFRANRGLAGKLLLAIKRCRDHSYQGLIAVVDQDRKPPREKLCELMQTRKQDRSNPKNSHLPTALGEARPHGEAWLLDDEKAVREALELPPETAVPSPTKVNYPKTALNELIALSKFRDAAMEALKEIAALVDQGRCIHGSETGFREFLTEVTTELGELAAGSSSSGC